LHKQVISGRGIDAIIDQYFAELAFIYAELYRTCRPLPPEVTVTWAASSSDCE
jgi:hypothetical protein